MDFNFLTKRVLSHSNKKQSAHEAQSIHFNKPGIQIREGPVFFNGASLYEASINGSRWDTQQKSQLRAPGVSVKLESEMRTFELWVNLNDGSQTTSDFVLPPSFQDPGCTTIAYGKFTTLELVRLKKMIQTYNA